jgi:hypothetical protein
MNYASQPQNLSLNETRVAREPSTRQLKGFKASSTVASSSGSFKTEEQQPFSAVVVLSVPD